MVEKFSYRAHQVECLHEHELLRKTNEDDDNYFNRLTDFWKIRFQELGFAYLLPHHFLELQPGLGSFRLVLDRPDIIKQVLFGSAEGMQRGSIAHTTELVNEMFPIVNDLPGNFAVSYNEDVMGKNLGNAKDYSHASIALQMAILQLDSPVVIGCNALYDPYCLLAGIFGGGKHCLALAINHYHHASVGESIGDIEILRIMIESARTLQTSTSALTIHDAGTTINSSIKINKLAFLHDVGMNLRLAVEETERKKREERFFNS